MNLFTRENLFHFLREFIWLLLTVMVTYAVIYPIVSKLDYTYTFVNAVFVFVALTYFRYCVALNTVAYLRSSVIRFGLFTANLVLFFYLMYNLQKLLVKLDNFYTEDLGFPKVILYDDLKRQLFDYMYTEVAFFGTASLVLLIALQLRLIISYWQYYKHAASRMLED